MLDFLLATKSGHYSNEYFANNSSSSHLLSLAEFQHDILYSWQLKFIRSYLNNYDITSKHMHYDQLEPVIVICMIKFGITI